MTPTTLVFDPARRERLPAPIALRARVLAHETELHGVHTTPDELADLIEASLDHLFRLWVAEFVHAGAPDPATARELVSRLGGKLLLGHRIGIAQRVREVFVRKQLPTVVEGLTVVDFGTTEDSARPVARLLAFRNGYAHGNFSATVSAIEAHRTLMEALLESVPGLLRQPVLAQTETGELLAFRGEVERVMAEPVDPAPALQPFVAARDGSARLDLFPLWRASLGEGGAWALLPPDPEMTGQGVEAFFEREALRQYAARWADERDGLFDHRPAVMVRAWRALDAPELAALREAIATVQLVLVEAHPGCGKAASLAAILDGRALAPGRFADVSAVVLEPGKPTQSAFTFAIFVARAVERALGLPPRGLFGEPGEAAGGGATNGGRGNAGAGVGSGGTRPSARKLRHMSPSGLARFAAERLAVSAKRVLVAIEDAHVGTRPAYGEKETVASVVRTLAGTAVHVVATTHPGALAVPFAHDRKVVMGIPATPRVERLVAALVAALGGRPLHRRALEVLAGQGGSSTLFTVCDTLDTAGYGPVFEPAVERALADLRLVLTTRRAGPGAEREWRIFHPAMVEALRQSRGAQ